MLASLVDRILILVSLNDINVEKGKRINNYKKKGEQ